MKLENPLTIEQTQILQRQLGLQTEMGYAALHEAILNVILLDRKQRDYGSTNISKWGITGIIVRMTDKFERLATIMTRKRRKAVNESVHDTFRDISNYAVIAILWLNGKWPR